jgi:hypothetical protein
VFPGDGTFSHGTTNNGNAFGQSVDVASSTLISGNEWIKAPSWIGELITGEWTEAATVSNWPINLEDG